MTSAGEITRRGALGLMAAGGAGFLVFGPRGQRADTRGRIVLDYWEKWTRHEGDAMMRVVDAFNQSQSRIFVRYLITADIGQKSLVAIAGGAPPDLIGLYAYNVPPYAESNALMSFDDLAPAFGLSLGQYAPGVRQVMQHRGRWWASVNTAGSVALYYNKRAFREVGLDPDRPPTTLPELDDAHRRLVKARDKGPLERVGFFHPEPGWWSWLWAYHFGGSIYDAQADRSLVDSPENHAAMAWMQSYARDLGPDRCKAFKESFGNYFTPENPFLTGKVAMIIQGPWLANLVTAFAPDFDYGVAPFPVAPGLSDPAAPVGLIDTDVLVIPRGARHPEASMEFVAWTQRQDMTELLASAHCKPSPLASTSPAFRATHPNRGIGVHYDIFQSPRAFVPPQTRAWQQFKDEVDTMVQRLWRLEVSPEAALPPLERRTQGFIDRAAEERRRRGGAS
ncbi:MAG: ABC transporter substrate-binding protein [Planctomycetota bacterium]|nr:ABC transporter substrate-binding protein [Planctomycetota bacterium]